MTAAEHPESIQVRISPDKMAATLVIDPGVSTAELNATFIGAMLDERGVSPSGRRNAAVDAAIKAAASGPVEMVVAEGTPPVHGIDARFEASVQGDEVAPAPDASGRVDHHAAKTFTAVRPGDAIGKVFPTVPGVDGVDVSGRTLAAKQGRAARMLFDDTIRVGPPNADGISVVTALRGGLLIRHGELVRVSDTLEIATDVDFAVGNIDFPGDVRIAGGIRDQFVIHAERDLEVRGLVEASNLAGDRDVRLISGMAAREKGSLRAGRDLDAKYLDGLTANGGRDTTVAKEVTNTSLDVGRNFKSPTCVVMGGTIAVPSLCEVAQLGSDAKVATEVILGRFPAIEAVLQRGQQALPALEDRVVRAKSRLEQLKRSVGKLTPAQAEELTELEFGVSEALSKLRGLVEGIRQTLKTARFNAKPRLIVHRMVCPGVKIWLGGYTLEPRADVRGPLEIALGPTGEPRLTLGNGAPISASGHFRVAPASRFTDFEVLDRVLDKALAA